MVHIWASAGWHQSLRPGNLPGKGASAAAVSSKGTACYLHGASISLWDNEWVRVKVTGSCFLRKKRAWIKQGFRDSVKQHKIQSQIKNENKKEALRNTENGCWHRKWTHQVNRFQALPFSQASNLMVSSWERSKRWDGRGGEVCKHTSLISFSENTLEGEGWVCVRVTSALDTLSEGFEHLLVPGISRSWASGNRCVTTYQDWWV